jgi:hypothetical protein
MRSVQKSICSRFYKEDQNLENPGACKGKCPNNYDEKDRKKNNDKGPVRMLALVGEHRGLAA